MPQRLPANLGPRARKLLLTATGDDVIRALCEVTAAADPDALRAAVADAGGTVRHWSDEARLLTVDLPVHGLRALAAVEGVAYVEVDSTYRP